MTNETPDFISTQEREALAEFLVENRDRGRGISAYVFTPLKMADALLAAGWTRPVSDEDMIERAAQVLAEHSEATSEQGYNRWHCDCGEVVSEGRKSKARAAHERHVAEALAAANLLTARSSTATGSRQEA